jgi:Xylose isomerase-like TIM barrel
LDDFQTYYLILNLKVLQVTDDIKGAWAIRNVRALLIRHGLDEQLADAFLMRLRAELVHQVINDDVARSELCQKIVHDLIEQASVKGGGADRQSRTQKILNIINVVILGAAGSALWDAIKIVPDIRMAIQEESGLKSDTFEARWIAIEPDHAVPRRALPSAGGISLNLATVLVQWKLREAVEAAVRHGFAGVVPWREMVLETGISKSADIFRDHDVRVTSYCRGGLFAAAGREKFRDAVDDNLRMIDEAAAIGAECIVVIGGGLALGSRDLAAARNLFIEGLAAILPHARACRLPLALEPMHPMYAADRGCIMPRSLRMCRVGTSQSEM